MIKEKKWKNVLNVKSLQWEIVQQEVGVMLVETNILVLVIVSHHIIVPLMTKNTNTNGKMENAKKKIALRKRSLIYKLITFNDYKNR